MIDFSPHTKYTAQKIQDKVTRGAYFYVKFDLTADPTADKIMAKIEKLNQFYDFNLSSRQRNYRLKIGKPIADLIVQQDVFLTENWHFYLLITTPKSRQHAEQTQESVLKKLAHETDKIKELDPKIWNKETENQEIEQIQAYFKDAQEFKFALNKPFLSLNFGGVEAELVRMNHKKYADEKDETGIKKISKYRAPKKSYSWTWRYTEKTMTKLRMDLTNILNRYVSQNNKNQALNDLMIWQKKLTTWAVFRGNRQQAGRLYTFGKSFFYSRKKIRWDAANLPLLRLTILPRLQTYAVDFKEYQHRRYLYRLSGYELPLDLARSLEEQDEATIIEFMDAYDIKQNQDRELVPNHYDNA